MHIWQKIDLNTYALRVFLYNELKWSLVMHKTSHRIIYNAIVKFNFKYRVTLYKVGRLFCAMIMRSNIGSVPILAKSGDNIISYEM